MKLNDIVATDAPGAEGLVRRLLRVDEKDLTLKLLFDHFRNYAVCAALIGAARLFGQVGLPLANVFAALILLVASSLVALNMAHGLVIASAFGIRRWAGFALGVLMFIVMGSLTVALGLFGTGR